MSPSSYLHDLFTVSDIGEGDFNLIIDFNFFFLKCKSSTSLPREKETKCGRNYVCKAISNQKNESAENQIHSLSLRQNFEKVTLQEGFTAARRFYKTYPCVMENNCTFPS